MKRRHLLIVDLFSGTGSSTQAFEDAGDEVFRVEKDYRHSAELHVDVMRVTSADLKELCGDRRPDFVWASPPCTAFSVSSIGAHWVGDGKVLSVPKTDAARFALKLVQHTLDLIAGLAPDFWLMENPRGMLRNQPVVQGLPRRTITYCQYGDPRRQKPTDLWGVMPKAWKPRPPCKPSASCHEAAPSGSNTGTQGLANATERARVPYDLGAEVRNAVAKALGMPTVKLRAPVERTLLDYIK